MQDPILNRNLEETKELAARWSQFHEFFKLGVKGEGITPQAEYKFLELKTRIAMLHDGFLRSAPRDQKIAQNVISIMAACILLRRIKGMNQVELQKIEYDWNEAYLLMTETISRLEDKRNELILVSETAFRFQQFRQRWLTSAFRTMQHPLFMGLAVCALLFFVFVGVPMLGLYDITRIKQDLPFTARFYDPVMGILRSAFSDLPYASADEIDFADISYGQPDRAALQRLSSRLEPKDFINQLVNRGVDVNDVDAASRIFERRRDYSALVYKDPEGMSLLTHQILFGSTEDAKEFVRLRAAGLDKMTDTELKFRIREKVTLCRRANLVVILEQSTPDYRRTFAQGKWGFRARQIDL